MKKEKQKKIRHTAFNRCILSLSNSKLINSILKLFLAAFVRRTISFGSCINAVLLPLSDVVEYKDLLTKINLSSRTLKLTHTHTHMSKFSIFSSPFLCLFSFEFAFFSISLSLSSLFLSLLWNCF